MNNFRKIYFEGNPYDNRKDKKYYVNKEKKIVAGTCEQYILDIIEYEIKNTLPHKLSEQFPFLSLFYNLDDLPPTITAKAKCDNKDEFDEKIGKNIVAKKLDYKAEARMAKQYRKLCKLFADLIFELDELGIKHQNKANNIKKSLQKYNEYND